MSGELGFSKFEIVPAHNCGIESLVTAARNLPLGRLPSAPRIEDALNGRHYNYDFMALFSLLEECGYGTFQHEQLYLPYSQTVCKKAVIDTLRGGAVCELTLVSHLWLENVRSETDDSIDPDELHSALVFGYYQPVDCYGPTWLYVADPYDDVFLFVAFDKVFKSLPPHRDIPLDVYGLIFDHANVRNRHGGIVNTRLLQSSKRRILRHIPGSTKEEKIASLFRE